jgi:dTDP-glucose 4,6-dehydratase
MPRVLLTGAGGFVGHHTLEHLLVTTDWEVVATDSFRHFGKTDRLTDVLASHPEQADRVTVVTHDLTVPWSAQGIERIGPIDYVINMASESHVDRSITDPVPFVRNNVDVALNMLELARVLQPQAFIAVSTDEVYGPAPDGHDHVEWSTILPSNPYAASKAAQEALAISYWRTYGVPVVLTNTMNLLGERQDPEKYVPMLISRIHRGEMVTIHGSPEVIGSRFYLHARNQADALVHILRNLPPQPYRDSRAIVMPDRYNVVGEREIDNRSLAELVAEYVGRPLRYRFEDFHATRPGHDRRYALDGTKLANLGWKAPVSLEESLRHTVEWTLRHGEWLLG